MANLTDTRKWLIANAAAKDAKDSQDRGPGQSTTPRVDMILDDISDRTDTE